MKATDAAIASLELNTSRWVKVCTPAKILQLLNKAFQLTKIATKLMSRKILRSKE